MKCVSIKLYCSTKFVVNIASEKESKQVPFIIKSGGPSPPGAMALIKSILRSAGEYCKSVASWMKMNISLISIGILLACKVFHSQSQPSQ